MIICPDCQRSNASRAKFCAGCGHPLNPHSASALTATEGPAPGATPPSEAVGRSVFLATPRLNENGPRLAEELPSGAPPPPVMMDFPSGGTVSYVAENPPSGGSPEWVQKMEGVVAPLLGSTDAQRVPNPEEVLCQGMFQKTDLLNSGAWAGVLPGGGENSGQSLSELGALEVGAGSESTLEVELNVNRLLIEGHGTTLEVRLRNTSSSELKHLEIELNSRAFSSKPRVRQRTLAGGTALLRPLELDPVKSGISILNCLVTYERDGRTVRLKGRSQLMVHVPPREGNLSVSVGNILSNNDHGGGTGADIRIGTLVDVSKIKTINDLISIVLPTHFMRIELENDFEVSVPEADFLHLAPAVRRIPASFLANVAPASKLTLIPIRNAREEGGEIPSICVVAGPLFRVGRRRDLVDYAAWFWPRSKENDERTKKISRDGHLSLRLENGLIRFEEADATNRSSFDGVEIPRVGGTSAQGASREVLGLELSPAKSQVVMKGSGILSVAREYKLELAMLETTMEGPLRISNERFWPGPPSLAPTVSAPCAAVRLMPCNSEVALHRVIWIFKDATFGRGGGNALVLEGAGLGEVHGRFMHHRSQFWMETLSGAEPIRVNGSPLNPGEIVPLVEGQSVQIGEIEYLTQLRRD